MARADSLDALQIEIGKGTFKSVAVSTDTNDVIPTLLNGYKPKYLFIRALPGGAASTGLDYITVSPNVSASNGNINTGLPLLVGQSVILNVSGFSHISLGSRANADAVRVQFYPLANGGGMNS